MIVRSWPHPQGPEGRPGPSLDWTPPASPPGRVPSGGRSGLPAAGKV